MKKINEMTDQEILSLTDAEVDKMIRFRLMEEGIAMIERPVEPEYEAYEGIIEAYSLSMLSFIVFEDERDAAKVLNVLNECESMVRTTSDWGLGEKVIYREVSNMNNNVSTERVSLIKKDDYSKAIRVKEKNDAVKEKYKAQMEVYAQYYGKWMNYTAEIYNIINDEIGRAHV